MGGGGAAVKVYISVNMVLSIKISNSYFAFICEILQMNVSPASILTSKCEVEFTPIP